MDKQEIRNGPMKKQNTIVRPYGDTPDDGMVQMSFSLPLSESLAKAAALDLAAKTGLSEPRVVHHQDIGGGFTFCIVYGKCVHTTDTSKLTVDNAVQQGMDFDTVNGYIGKTLRRPIVVVGACIETDAHTVGIDAILNMKGFHGNPGLERYPWFKVVNMGAQVPSEELIQAARKADADVILVSQIVTQQNIHLHNLTKLIDMLEAENIRNRFLLVVGGPSIDNAFAKELGYDAGFGRGTVPSDVATFIAQRIAGK